MLGALWELQVAWKRWANSWILFRCRKPTSRYEPSRSNHNTKRLLQRLRQANRRASHHSIGQDLASGAFHLVRPTPSVPHRRRLTEDFHFSNHCNQELGTRNFFERDGNPYCEPDYHNLFSPRCAYCNGAILDVRVPGHQCNHSSSKLITIPSLSEMRDCFGQDLAHRALLLCPVRQPIRRGRLP